MKFRSLFAIVLLSLIVSCHKDTLPQRNLSPFAIPGTWKWVLTTGGFTSMHLTPATEGYNVTYIFNADSSYLIIKGTDTTRGNWHTGIDTLRYPGHVYDTIGFGGVHNGYTYTHNMDSLFLDAPCCDRFNFVLVKQ